MLLQIGKKPSEKTCFILYPKDVIRGEVDENAQIVARKKYHGAVLVNLSSNVMIASKDKKKASCSIITKLY